MNVYKYLNKSKVTRQKKKLITMIKLYEEQMEEHEINKMGIVQFGKNQRIFLSSCLSRAFDPTLNR